MVGYLGADVANMGNMGFAEQKSINQEKLDAFCLY